RRTLTRSVLLFFFTAPATTEIYTLSLHDALPISTAQSRSQPNCDATRIPAASPSKAQGLNSPDGECNRQVFGLAGVGASYGRNALDLLAVASQAVLTQCL